MNISSATFLDTYHYIVNNTVKCTAQNRSVTRNDYRIFTHRDHLAFRPSLSSRKNWNVLPSAANVATVLEECRLDLSQWL